MDLIIFLVEFLICGKMTILGIHTSIEYELKGDYFLVRVRHNKEGFVAFQPNSQHGLTMCPGDFVLIQYADIPIVRDMYCEDKNFIKARDDFQFGGTNDWTILDFQKQERGGFNIQIKRKKYTGDKFDRDIRGTPDIFNYAVHYRSHIF